MVDDPKAKPDQARVLRARAVQARRMSGQIGGDADRKSLVAYADGLDTLADQLDPRRPGVAPLVTRHQNPVQMQQSRVTPPANDDADDPT